MIKHNADNPQFIANVNGKFSAVDVPIGELSSILAKRRMRLQKALVDIEELNVTAERVRNEVMLLETDFKAAASVSVEWDVLQRQMLQLKVCSESVLFEVK